MSKTNKTSSKIIGFIVALSIALNFVLGLNINASETGDDIPPADTSDTGTSDTDTSDADTSDTDTTDTSDTDISDTFDTDTSDTSDTDISDTSDTSDTDISDTSDTDESSELPIPCEECGELDCNLEHFYCDECGGLDCYAVHFYCDEKDCFIVDCTFTHWENCKCHIIGDVDGNGEINILDANEILMYMAGMSASVIDASDVDSRAYKAALVLENETPSFWDFMEIMLYLAKSPSVLNGAPPPIIKPAPMKAVFDEREGVIIYYTTEEIETTAAYEIDFFVDGYVTDMEWEYKSGGFFKEEVGNNSYRIRIRDNIPSGTLIGTQLYKRNKNDTNNIVLNGNIIVETIPILMGDLNNDGAVTIEDALEILMHLSGISDTIYGKGFSFKAALIVGEERPVIDDVLQILMYLAGMPCLLG